MSVTNKIKVEWEFDIETNEELQSRLGLTESDVNDMLSDEYDAERLHSLCCGETGAPRYVDLDLIFDDPHYINDCQITNTLSDEYGWLIKSWHYIQQRVNPED